MGGEDVEANDENAMRQERIVVSELTITEDRGGAEANDQDRIEWMNPPLIEDESISETWSDSSVETPLMACFVATLLKRVSVLRMKHMINKYRTAFRGYTMPA